MRLPTTPTALFVFALSLIHPIAGANETGNAPKSANEIARELANPNTPLATLSLKNQFTWFDGDLPHADGQTGSLSLFQPSLPIALDNGAMLFFRPAIPIIHDQPVFDIEKQDFKSQSGLGDISFDLAYGRNTPSGFYWAAGAVSSIPTATSSDLGNGMFTLGPEILFGKLAKTYVIGAYPNHQWSVGGWGEKPVNRTSAQIYAILLPGNAWSVGSAPTIAYDWESDQWTVPLHLTVGRTVLLRKKPWRFTVEISYFVEKPDAFGPDITISINIAPVVKNKLSDWVRSW
jgi:hypothetical protein